MRCFFYMKGVTAILIFTLCLIFCSSCVHKLDHNKVHTFEDLLMYESALIIRQNNFPYSKYVLPVTMTYSTKNNIISISRESEHIDMEDISRPISQQMIDIEYPLYFRWRLTDRLCKRGVLLDSITLRLDLYAVNEAREQLRGCALIDFKITNGKLIPVSIRRDIISSDRKFTLELPNDSK